MATYDTFYNFKNLINRKSSDFSSGYNFSIFSQRKIQLQKMTHSSDDSLQSTFRKIKSEKFALLDKNPKTSKISKNCWNNGFLDFSVTEFFQRNMKGKGSPDKITLRTGNWTDKPLHQIEPDRSADPWTRDERRYRTSWLKSTK